MGRCSLLCAGCHSGGDSTEVVRCAKDGDRMKWKCVIAGKVITIKDILYVLLFYCTCSMSRARNI